MVFRMHESYIFYWLKSYGQCWVRVGWLPVVSNVQRSCDRIDLFSFPAQTQNSIKNRPCLYKLRDHGQKYYTASGRTGLRMKHHFLLFTITWIWKENKRYLIARWFTYPWKVSIKNWSESVKADYRSVPPRRKKLGKKSCIILLKNRKFS